MASKEYAEYIVKLSADTSNLESYLGKVNGSLKHLQDDEVLIKLDYDGNIKKFNQVFDQILKMHPELSIQFQYDANEKILNKELDKLKTLEEIKIDIDSGNANKSIATLIDNLKKGVDDDIGIGVAENLIKGIYKRANTIKAAGGNIGLDISREIYKVLENTKYEKVFERLGDNINLDKIKLFNFSGKVEDEIKNSKTKINDLEKYMLSLESKGAKKGGLGTGSGSDKEIQYLKDEIKIITEDIKELREQTEGVSGELFKSMSDDISDLNEKLQETLQRLSDISSGNYTPKKSIETLKEFLSGGINKSKDKTQEYWSNIIDTFDTLDEKTKTLLKDFGLLNSEGKLTAIKDGANNYGGLIGENNTVIVRQNNSIENIKKLKTALDLASEAGINCARTIEAVETANGAVIELQSTIKGNALAIAGSEATGYMDVFDINALNASDEHIQKLYSDLKKLWDLGIAAEIDNPSNLIYDQKKGFGFIDLDFIENTGNQYATFEDMWENFITNMKLNADDWRNFISEINSDNEKKENFLSFIGDEKIAQKIMSGDLAKSFEKFAEKGKVVGENFGNAIIDGVREGIDTHSNSKEAEKAVDDEVNGLIDQLDKRNDDVKEAGRKQAKTLIDSIKEELEKGISEVGAFINVLLKEVKIEDIADFIIDSQNNQADRENETYSELSKNEIRKIKGDKRHVDIDDLKAIIGNHDHISTDVLSIINENRKAADADLRTFFKKKDNVPVQSITSDNKLKIYDIQAIFNALQEQTNEDFSDNKVWEKIYNTHEKYKEKFNKEIEEKLEPLVSSSLIDESTYNHLAGTMYNSLLLSKTFEKDLDVEKYSYEFDYNDIYKTILDKTNSLPLFDKVLSQIDTSKESTEELIKIFDKFQSIDFNPQNQDDINAHFNIIQKLQEKIESLGYAFDETSQKWNKLSPEKSVLKSQENIQDEIDETINSIEKEKEELQKLESILKGDLQFKGKKEVTDALRYWHNSINADIEEGKRPSDRKILAYRNVYDIAKNDPKLKIADSSLDRYFNAGAIGRFDEALRNVNGSYQVQLQSIQLLENKLDELRRIQNDVDISSSTQEAIAPVDKLGEELQETGQQGQISTEHITEGLSEIKSEAQEARLEIEHFGDTLNGMGYHATKAEWDVFDFNKSGEKKNVQLGSGMYLSDDTDVAKFAKKGVGKTSIKEVEVALEKCFIITNDYISSISDINEIIGSTLSNDAKAKDVIGEIRRYSSASKENADAFRQGMLAKGYQGLFASDHLANAVNKNELVIYDESKLDKIKSFTNNEFQELTHENAGFTFEIKGLDNNNLLSEGTTPSAIDEITQAEDRMGNEAQEATDQARQGLAEMREEAEKTTKSIADVLTAWNGVDTSSNERFMLANSQSGYHTDPTAQGDYEFISQELVNSAIKNAEETVDTMIHTHPDKLAAFSHDDIFAAVEEMQQGIVHQYVKADSEVSYIDFSKLGSKIWSLIAKDFERRYNQLLETDGWNEGDNVTQEMRDNFQSKMKQTLKDSIAFITGKGTDFVNSVYKTFSIDDIRAMQSTSTTTSSDVKKNKQEAEAARENADAQRELANAKKESFQASNETPDLSIYSPTQTFDNEIQENLVMLENYKNTLKEIDDLKVNPETEESKRKIEELNKLADYFASRINTIRSENNNEINRSMMKFSGDWNNRLKSDYTEEQRQDFYKVAGERSGLQINSVITEFTGITDIIQKIESQSENLRQSLNASLSESRGYVEKLRTQFLRLIDNELELKISTDQEDIEDYKKDIAYILDKYPQLEQFMNKFTAYGEAKSFAQSDEWNDFLATLPEAKVYLEALGYDFERLNQPVAGITGQTQALEQQEEQAAETREELEKLNEAQDEQPQNQPFTPLGSTRTEEEIEALSRLNPILDDIIGKINDKTEAFIRERETVEGEVQREVTDLEQLDGQLLLVKETIEKLVMHMASIDVDVSSISEFIKQIRSLNNIKTDKLSDIAKAIKDFSKEVKNIKINDSSLISAINNIISKGDEIKALAKVVNAGAKTIKEAGKTVNEDTNKKDKTLLSSVEKANAEAVKYTNHLYDERLSNLASIQRLYEQNDHLTSETQEDELKRIHNWEKIVSLMKRNSEITELLQGAEATNTIKEEEFAEAVKSASAEIQHQRDLIVARNQDLSNVTLEESKDSAISSIEKMQNSLGKIQLNKFTDDLVKRIGILKEQLSSLADAIKNVDSQSDLDNLKNDLSELNSEFNKIQYDKTLSSEKLAAQSSLEKLSKNIEDIIAKNTKMGDSFKQQFEDIGTRIKSAKTIEEVEKLKAEIISLETELIKSGKAGKSFFNVFTNRLVDMNAKFFAQYFSFQDLLRYAREAFEQIRNIDSALIELKKVSDASTTRLQESFSESAETAQELGSTINDVINITADWSRLGYSIDDAEKLAEVTTLFKTVGDNMTAETASQALISTLKGYEMGADEALSVIDKYNEVANNFAIDTEGISQAIERGGASLHAAKNDLSESLGLIVAANDSVQNPESVGQMLKTNIVLMYRNVHIERI